MMMRHLSRLGLALVLTLGVLSTPAFAGGVDAALKYVPAEFTTVIAVDVQALQKSALGQMVQAMLANNPGAQEMEKELGFNPNKDLSTLVVAGPDAFMSHDEQFVIILEAKVDAAALVTFLKKQAGDALTEKKIGSSTMYQIDKDGAFAVDGPFVVAGYAPLVEKALAAKAGKNVTTGPLKSVIKRFKGAKGGFAAITAGKKVHEVLGGDIPDFAQLESAGFGLDVKSGAGITLVGNFKSDKAAGEVAKALQGMLKEAANDPDLKEMGLGRVVGGMTIKAEGKALEIGASMGDDEVKKLIATMFEGQH